jgi:hypothetical protein
MENLHPSGFPEIPAVFTDSIKGILYDQSKTVHITVHMCDSGTQSLHKGFHSVVINLLSSKTNDEFLHLQSNHQIFNENMNRIVIYNNPL